MYYTPSFVFVEHSVCHEPIFISINIYIYYIYITYTYIYIYTCSYTYILFICYIYMYVYIYVCMCVCIYIYRILWTNFSHEAILTRMFEICTYCVIYKLKVYLKSISSEVSIPSAEKVTWVDMYRKGRYKYFFSIGWENWAQHLSGMDVKFLVFLSRSLHVSLNRVLPSPYLRLHF